jgi:hypothetical protein
MTADLRRRLLLLAAALFTAWGMWQVRDAGEPASRAAPARRTATMTSVAGVLSESSAGINLPTRAATTEPVRDLFQLPQPPAPPASAQNTAPQAPPLPFGYLGGITDAGGSQVFLSVGVSTLVAKPGTRLTGGWLLETVEPGRLVFNYEALQQRQYLATGDRR